MNLVLILLFQTAWLVHCTVASGLPNVIFFLTDDQDVKINGMTPISKAKELIGDKGIYFDNMFVNSPLCCPSRSSILTGNYVHNHGALNNSLAGNCSSRAWQDGSEKKTFITHLKQQGYSTFFAGKYLNQYGFPASGGVEHIPPGWDDWNGLVGNSRYYNYTLSANGQAEAHKDKYEEDYLTDVISKKAQAFLDKQTNRSVRKPIMMMLSTPAAHAPFTPAPQYENDFSDEYAPRHGSFNFHGGDKHWLIRATKHPLSKEALEYIDPTYRNRWRTLLSVDDMIEKVVKRLESMGELENSYIIYASDNGFHLGQFCLPNDKRQLYEFDIRVPLMIRGPGITPGQRREEMVVNIDLAPTFIEMAGLSPPTDMDGESFFSILKGNEPEPLKHRREDFLVEHYGEHMEANPPCSQYRGQGMYDCEPDCVCEDSWNNTYNCVRTLSRVENFIFCEFKDNENFVEAYDLNTDPDQLHNIVSKMSLEQLQRHKKRLQELSTCKDRTCKLWKDSDGQLDEVLRFKPAH